MLFAAFARSALHTINHLFDIGDTDPGWLGPANFIALVLLTGDVCLPDAGGCEPDERTEARPGGAASERLPA